MVLSYIYNLYIELLGAIQDINSALERFLIRQFGITKLSTTGSTAINNGQLPSLPLFTKVLSLTLGIRSTSAHFRDSC